MEYNLLAYNGQGEADGVQPSWMPIQIGDPIGDPVWEAGP
jgi:hypothetical protein